jgi:uncharacterized protein (DUF983 family)
MKKGTKLYSIIKLKCPRCQIGNLFSNTNFFVFKEALVMPNSCPHCKQDFKIEPGFYTAALWISYPIVLIVFIPLVVFGFLLDNLQLFFKFLLPFFVLLILMVQVPIMRISRAILINISVDYEEF